MEGLETIFQVEGVNELLRCTVKSVLENENGDHLSGKFNEISTSMTIASFLNLSNKN